MLNLHNVDDVTGEYTEEWEGTLTKKLGAMAGGEKLYANLDIVMPGASSTKLHAHTRQEEFFLVLAGRGELITPEGRREVGAGDFIAKPAGLENAHRFDNTGGEPMQILDVGTVEAGDVSYYPDTGEYRLRDEQISLVRRDD